ncbi:small leucine-rich protein 1 [Tachysurus ichikawai]
MSLLVVFLNHVPGWFLCFGLFLPVSLLLLLLIRYLTISLDQVEMELSEVRDPQETAQRLYTYQHHRYGHCHES